MKVKNYLLGYKNMYISQDTEKFNFSLDSVLLPNFITINKGIKRILDIGCGNAPIPLILSTKTNVDIIGVEIQKESYELALESVNMNGLDKQIMIINDDINEYYRKTESDYFDIITCNPPFFKVGDNSNLNENESKSLARHELTLSLEQVIKISKKLLKNNGVLGIVHRTERLVDILCIMRQNNIEPKKIRFVYPKKGKQSNIILVEGRKNGKEGLKIMPPLFVHKNNGDYTEEVIKYFE